MQSKRFAEDDFVLTLSDNDEASLSDQSEEETETAAGQGLNKRKRSNDTVTSRKRNKAIQADSDSDEQDKNVKDHTIDSDFEFDLGDNLLSNTVEDFDGWGINDTTGGNKKAGTTKKDADIDDIIARRAARKQNDVDSRDVKAPSASEHREFEEENKSIAGQSSEGEEIDFGDENLENDVFGAADVPREDNDEEEEDDDEGDGDESLFDQDREVGDEKTSDSDSVASPIEHPDDLAGSYDSENGSSDQDDVEEEERRRAFFAPETKAEPVNHQSSDSFQTFSLSRPILRALTSLSFTSPTPIQARTIPVALQGIDVVGSAQTGSGKTAAFLLPILERLIYRPRKIPTTRVAVLMPTRELAVQCYNVAIALARFTDITFAQVVGGFSLREQEAILKKRPDVVIATPGRFIDHMRNSSSFVVENLEILVLDEADRMLEQGFADELDEILRAIPKSRQTMLFSATMTDSVDKLVRVGMNRPVRVSVDAKRSTVAGLIQEFVRLRPGREDKRLASLCLLCTKIADYKERTIVFFRQKKEAHRVRIIFGLLGVKVAELHGSMSQDQRIKSVNAFRDGQVTHLLATDVASRGLDIKNVVSIVNYEAPQTHEIYLHRVGRTARAGRSGKACTIAAEPDRKIVKSAVKAAREQGAKVTSRVLEVGQVNSMDAEIEGFADEIEEILNEEKQEKQLVRMEAEVQRGENLVKHHDEIMSRPKRTWFESEKEKKAAKDKARAELNGGPVKGDKKKLSNKDRKRMDSHREHAEGRQWKKGKRDAEATKDGKKKSRSKGKAEKKRKR